MATAFEELRVLREAEVVADEIWQLSNLQSPISFERSKPREQQRT
jgi:hypothetical protein